MDIQSSWGFVCCWVTDEHRLQAIGELQSPVNPFVLGRANYVTNHPIHSWVGHFEWQGWHQPAVERIQFEFSQESVLLCSEILELRAGQLHNLFLVRHRSLKYFCDKSCQFDWYRCGSNCPINHVKVQHDSAYNIQVFLQRRQKKNEENWAKRQKSGFRYLRNLQKGTNN